MYMRESDGAAGGGGGAGRTSEVTSVVEEDDGAAAVDNVVVVVVVLVDAVGNVFGVSSLLINHLSRHTADAAEVIETHD